MPAHNAPNMTLTFLSIDNINLPAEISQRHEWLLENKAVIGKYKYATLKETLNYAELEYQQFITSTNSEKANAFKHQLALINAIFDKISTTSDIKFLIAITKIIDNENERQLNDAIERELPGPYFTTCRAYDVIQPVIQAQQKELMKDTGILYLSCASPWVLASTLFTPELTAAFLFFYALSCVATGLAVKFNGKAIKTAPKVLEKLQSVAKTIDPGQRVSQTMKGTAKIAAQAANSARLTFTHSINTSDSNPKDRQMAHKVGL